MKKTGVLLLAGAFLAIIGCNDKKDKKMEDESQMQNEKEAMIQQGDTAWEDLFNGVDFEGWKAYNSDSISDQWQVKDSAMVFTPAEGDRQGSENLITKDVYKNFELSFEWKISEGGNSGVMWAVQEDPAYPEPYMTGPEIQVLDNERHPDAKNGTTHRAGALYDLVPPSKDVTKPAGEWNKEVIKIDHKTNKGTVTLNGEKVTEFPVHGDEWQKMIDKSKFTEWKDFGKNESGHIALQDHGNQVSYRNIKIRKLD
ncbi:MAG: DUF1080 domain-containing protein [Salegentibacter sp.]